MPQEIRVLHCFNCKIFQVDIVKKLSKWQCRVCNTKQTVRKEYFRGTGTECRIKVQELNMTKGQKHNETVGSYLNVLNTVNEINCSLENNIDHNDVTSNNIVKDELSIERDCEPSSSISEFNMMFDFSQTKKWSSKRDQSSSNDYQLTSSTKKSKWDNYV
ncbi:MRN complex-interacting protein [Calliphora vicina]|uniref:MRN complex-interacting protein n=1 Tax=Calliphora vicina TaxID=7373 RepID=UPI00325B5A84